MSKHHAREPLHPAADQAWWRTGVMWLVVGGPLTVVVAGIVTALIALQGADDVLDQEARAHSSADAPALKARNHAATPDEPPR
ncbi:MAG: nitrogen fixation protein FixH [Burkholderiales bacterium]|nr:nitrogen fixation protein FixH [Burkholderiales bacterium]